MEPSTSITISKTLTKEERNTVRDEKKILPSVKNQDGKVKLITENTKFYLKISQRTSPKETI